MALTEVEIPQVLEDRRRLLSIRPFGHDFFL
jgi:hypothetical protein